MVKNVSEKSEKKERKKFFLSLTILSKQTLEPRDVLVNR